MKEEFRKQIAVTVIIVLVFTGLVACLGFLAWGLWF